MMTQSKPKVGFTCAYTPTILIEAAGFVPHRLFPTGDWPDQAGRMLHDNICPHVKRILDQALADDLPELSGVIFVNSCDAMRRLYDAWQKLRPNARMFLIDLPVTADEASFKFLGSILANLWKVLNEWQEKPQSADAICQSIEQFNALSEKFDSLRKRIHNRELDLSRSELQKLYIQCAAQSFDDSLNQIDGLLKNRATVQKDSARVPVFVFGNVLADPEAFALIESCGAAIVDDDLCVSSRMFYPIQLDSALDVFDSIARSLLSKHRCARTIDNCHPVGIAEEIATSATACNARGVIGHTVKFCDPYLARLPIIRETLKAKGIPLLILEGDCSLRSVGQHRTRIEAFIEML